LFHGGTESATFALLVVALADAHVHPKGIEVFIHTDMGLNQFAFNVLNGRSEQRVKDMLGKLKRLFLTVDSASAPADLGPIQKFLLAAAGLESLRLNMVRCQREDPLLKWMSSLPDQDPARLASETCTDSTARHEKLDVSQYLGDTNEAHLGSSHRLELSPASGFFTHLRKLDIGFARITHRVLLRILTRLRLHELSLWKITLLSERQPAIHEEVKQDWPIFLRDLGNSDQPLLRAVVIGEVAAGPLTIGPSNLLLYVGARWLPEEDSASPEQLLPLAPSLKQIKYHAQSGQSASEWLVEAADRMDRVAQPLVRDGGHGRWAEMELVPDPVRPGMFQHVLGAGVYDSDDEEEGFDEGDEDDEDDDDEDDEDGDSDESDGHSSDSN
jgi:hypothetical protein